MVCYCKESYWSQKHNIRGKTSTHKQFCYDGFGPLLYTHSSDLSVVDSERSMDCHNTWSDEPCFGDNQNAVELFVVGYVKHFKM